LIQIVKNKLKRKQHLLSMLSPRGPAAFVRYFPCGPAAQDPWGLVWASCITCGNNKKKENGKREAHLLIGRWHASKRTNAKLVLWWCCQSYAYRAHAGAATTPAGIQLMFMHVCLYKSGIPFTFIFGYWI
jgi:hypothetical protein